jgi:hypothetical protein
MDLGVHDLYASFADAFAILRRGAGKRISVEIQIPHRCERAHGDGRGYGVRSAPIYPGTGSGIARPTPTLFNLYSDKDTRKAVTFLTSYVYNGVTTTLSSTDPDFTKAVVLSEAVGQNRPKPYRAKGPATPFFAIRTCC